MALPARMSIAAILISMTLALAGPAAAGALNFTLPTAEGQKLRLADYRGRVVVLDFFATWCRPCKAEMPKLKRMHAEYASQGLSVIGYSVDQKGVKAVLPYVRNEKINFPVVLGTPGQARQLAGVSKLPTTVVLDPQGRIIARFEGVVGQDRLLAAARPYFNRRAPRAPAVAATPNDPGASRRLGRLWITPNYQMNGQIGFLVHVIADVLELDPNRGLWLALHLRPEARQGSKLIPLGEPKKLYQRIDDNSQQHFVLFVRCDQVPQVPSDGVFRAWVTLLGPGLKPMESTGEFMVSRPLDSLCSAH